MFYSTARNDHGLPHDPLLAIVSPRPVGWITSLSASGVVNLAPYSYFNIYSRKPPLVGFSSNGRKHTVTNVEYSKEFVCNLATWSLIDAVNETSAPLPDHRSELEYAGLEAAPGRLVKTPRVAASPCALECVWTETIILKGQDGQRSANYLVCGEVVGVHIDERFIVDGLLDITLTRNLARCGYLDYSSVESLTSRPRPTVLPELDKRKVQG